MKNSVLIWIVVAFLVGAVAPLLGLLAAAFGLGSWLNGGNEKLCDSKLLSEIKDIERSEHRKLRQRR